MIRFIRKFFKKCLSTYQEHTETLKDMEERFEQERRELDELLARKKKEEYEWLMIGEVLKTIK